MREVCLEEALKKFMIMFQRFYSKRHEYQEWIHAFAKC